MNKKKLLVAGLENGTVIDHIPSEKLFKVVSMLKLDKLNSPITIGNNLESKKYGKKGIIKIADKYFKEEEVARIALISTNIRLNRIENYEVVDKKKVELSDDLKGIVKCNNPKCISNNEPMLTHFHVVDKEELTLKCHYCEKEVTKDDIILL